MSRIKAPRIEIHLGKLAHNAKILKTLFGEKGIEVTAVVKGVTADLAIASSLINGGITSLADSKIMNIKKLKEAKLDATLILLRTPALSDIEQVVEYADVSMNTEIEVIRALSAEALRQQKIHSIILMVEMGDLREGILPKHLPAFIRQIQNLKGVQIVGIGTNFACFGGVIPTEQKMRQFSSFVRSIKKQFSLPLVYVSGGNSANYQWLLNTKDVGTVNNIRLGESMLLGRETIHGTPISNLYQDAFRFVAEVIESKRKPSVPIGKTGNNFLGESLSFEDRGTIRRAILGVGRQDVYVPGLTPILPVDILGSSSDHIVLDAKKVPLKPGDEVAFSVNYGALLSAMTSPYVYKKYIYSSSIQRKKLQKTLA
ncbi:alanine/ornithine racemase family PLP-dependent enzyme [Oceanobacillus piezotolerans]|uniref:Alanine/ornithine racemase family PLP-dependent enzyme n=1 Tax=Oceanobacillus piezotolerans TaxID=2448030 RepID=A0A498DE72_9BACI|nr:alanine/ornithine racemase family PLP-dependent enzyme [Oceanobacillus piezotolerans]RLL48376.1 alanine/ornithine racemase family PLP-dependent enzyme [Oceanobacillus piezotolerans]